jgi:hypothetical protein
MTPALRLPALAEEDHVMAREDRVLDLGDDGLVVADDAGQDALAPREPSEEVLPHLLADREDPVAGGSEITQRAQRVGVGHE